MLTRSGDRCLDPIRLDIGTGNCWVREGTQPTMELLLIARMKRPIRVLIVDDSAIVQQTAD